VTRRAGTLLPSRTLDRSPALALALVLALVLAAGAPAPAQTPTAAPSPAAPRWWKGNTHTHTLNSDGDTSPGEVAHWYRDHGYDFLCISDHNYLTRTEELQREMDREALRDAKLRRLLLIPGEEVTDRAGDARIHVNGIDTRRQVGKQGGASKDEVLRRCVDAIIEAGGVPSVSHPNYLWSITADDLAALERLRLFEIYNGHPGTHSFGGGGSPGAEEMWDALLTRGVRILGIAVDDAHDWRTWGPRACNPGRGWIVVRAPELSVPAIRAGIEAGDFYASTGVALADVTCTANVVRVRIAPEVEEATRYTTHFVGQGGKVLATETGLDASYAMRAGDEYVRVRVVSSIREYAWTQPFFPRPDGR
jgi:hypothetical protein